MYKLIAQSGQKAYGLRTLACDTVEDLVALNEFCEFGDVCIVLDTSDLFMMNSLREWKKISFSTDADGDLDPEISTTISTLGIAVMGNMILGE